MLHLRNARPCRELAITKRAALRLKCRQCFYRLGTLVRAFHLIDPECHSPAFVSAVDDTVMVLFLEDARDAVMATDVRARTPWLLRSVITAPYKSYTELAQRIVPA